MTLPLLGLGLMAAPLFAADMARPGTVNYVEGAAYIDGQPVNSKDIGSLALQPGQELTTGQQSKAEVLLTPGVFLRVGDNSAVKMISPDLASTEVQLEKGRAGVEVDELQKENNLQVLDAGVPVRLEKPGYYEFDASRPELMVFKGKADVELPDASGKQVKGNHQFLLAENGEPLAHEKPQKLSDDKSADDLLNWSRLRSHYLAEANNRIAGEYASAAYAPGWFWDPYMFGYTYIGPGALYSPWGWGFAPFGWYSGWGGGWYGPAWYGGGYYGGGYYGGDRDGDDHVQGYSPRMHQGVRPGGPVHSSGPRFREAPRSSFGGGLRSGGGNFHGGMSGGFHGSAGSAHGGR